MKIKLYSKDKEVVCKDITLDEIVNNYMEDDFISYEWNDYTTTIDDLEYFFEDYILTESEKEEVFSSIQKCCKKRLEELKQIEMSKLKNRKCILNFLNNFIEDVCDEEQIGYLLSTEEILDLIIKNGNK